MYRFSLSLCQSIHFFFVTTFFLQHTFAKPIPSEAHFAIAYLRTELFRAKFRINDVAARSHRTIVYTSNLFSVLWLAFTWTGAHSYWHTNTTLITQVSVFAVAFFRFAHRGAKAMWVFDGVRTRSRIAWIVAFIHDFVLTTLAYKNEISFEIVTVFNCTSNSLSLTIAECNR